MSKPFTVIGYFGGAMLSIGMCFLNYPDPTALQKVGVVLVITGSVVLGAILGFIADNSR